MIHVHKAHRVVHTSLKDEIGQTLAHVECSLVEAQIVVDWILPAVAVEILIPHEKNIFSALPVVGGSQM